MGLHWQRLLKPTLTILSYWRMLEKPTFDSWDVKSWQKKAVNWATLLAIAVNFHTEPRTKLLSPTCDGQTVMWGWEWYQPTTLMGRPVISANLCVSQGAFETSRANGSFFHKEKQESFKRASHQPTEFQMPLRRGDKTCSRKLMEASSPALAGCHCCRSKLDFVGTWQ